MFGHPAGWLAVLHGKHFNFGHYMQSPQPNFFHTCHTYRHHWLLPFYTTFTMCVCVLVCVYAWWSTDMHTFTTTMWLALYIFLAQSVSWTCVYNWPDDLASLDVKRNPHIRLKSQHQSVRCIPSLNYLANFNSFSTPGSRPKYTLTSFCS